MEIIKVLGQKAAAATTEETLYTVPDLTQTTCSSLVVCNRTAGALTFRISIAVAGATTATKDYLFYDLSLSGNQTFSTVLGLTLGQTDEVRTYASGTGLSFSLFGIETTKD